VKSEGQVEHKLRQVLYRHLQKKLRANFKRAPDTCLHHDSLQVGAHTIGICGLEEGPQGVVCDERDRNGIRANECPFWDPRPKEQVKAEFQMFLDRGNRATIAAEFPDAAALMWVLEQETLGKEDNQDPELETGADVFEDEPEPPPNEPEESTEIAAIEVPIKRWDWRRWPWTSRAGAFRWPWPWQSWPRWRRRWRP